MSSKYDPDSYMREGLVKVAQHLRTMEDGLISMHSSKMTGLREMVGAQETFANLNESHADRLKFIGNLSQIVADAHKNQTYAVAASSYSNVNFRHVAQWTLIILFVLAMLFIFWLVHFLWQISNHVF